MAADEGREIESELRRILERTDADAAYDALPGCMGGKILNADMARELSPRYKTIADRIAFTNATYAPARDYVFNRSMRTIKSSRGKLAMILAGGAASGKSTSVRGLLERADLVFDSNCAEFQTADKGSGVFDSDRRSVMLL